MKRLKTLYNQQLNQGLNRTMPKHFQRSPCICQFPTDFSINYLPQNDLNIFQTFFLLHVMKSNLLKVQYVLLSFKNSKPFLNWQTNTI